MSVAAAAWSRWSEADRAITRHGVVVDSERGIVKNPAVQVARDSEQTMRQCWAELGLSPAARERLHVPETPADDDGLFS